MGGAFDKITFALKRITGQRQALTAQPTPDLIPVDLSATGPEPRQRAHEIAVIASVVVAVTQGRNDLIGSNRRMGLSHGLHRPARPDLDKYPPRHLRKMGNPVSKAYRAAQMRNPVIGAGRLIRGQGLPRTVR